MTATSDATSNTLHPRIAEIIAELDASHAELHETVRAMTPEQLHAPAVGDEWSVAQILEHLSMTEDGMGRMFSKMRKELEANDVRETETSSVLGLNDRWGIATGNVPVIAPERVRPSQGLSPEESMRRIDEARERLLDAMRRGSGYAFGTITLPHPVFGPFNGYQWALANAQHSRRHIRQLRRVAGIGTA